MEEKLWSGQLRGFFEFQQIVPMEGLPQGAIGLAAGSKGSAAFFSYIKTAKVAARLVSQGFEQAGRGAPHPWFLRLAPGVVTPAQKAMCRELTSEQRSRIEANRLAALERRRRLCEA